MVRSCDPNWRPATDKSPSLDAACTIGSGEGVSIDNPGCLGESGRGSVHVAAEGGQIVTPTYCLVMTANSDKCACQHSHIQFTPRESQCLVLPTDENILSYRFIQVSGHRA